jgi:hypothetical protein
MNPRSSAPPKPFAAAAGRVAGRLALRTWCRLLGRSAIPLFATASAGWIALRSLGIRDHDGWAVALLALWLGATAFVAWWQRPRPFAALAAWDRAVGENETLANAWFFEHSADPSPGARLHLSLSRERLPGRASGLARQLPLHPRPVVVIAPALFLAFVFSGWLRAPVSVEDRGLSPEVRARARDVGGQLADKAHLVEPLKSLTDQERERVEALKRELEKAARQLGRKDSPRDLLEDLERNAREAEKLADALGGEAPPAPSQELLAELESNADTADLGNALRAEDLGRAADEAQRLATRLDGETPPSLEEQNRLQEALKRALARANAGDRASALGKSLAASLGALSQGSPKAAAAQFANLGRQFGRAAQRQGMQQRLRGLAQNFRGAGQSILGGSNLQRLTQSASPGFSPLVGSPPSGAGQSAPASSFLQPMPGSGAQPLALVPAPPGIRSGGHSLFPIPGAGSGQPPGGMAMPIPGGGGTPDGAGAFPIPGGGGGQPGGSLAGRGTVPLGTDRFTPPITPANTGMVTPVHGAEGPSEVRAVAAASHAEAPSRSAKQIAVDFIKGEETALADEPLPAARRDQVLLYFTVLRQQFEKQP